MATKKVKRKQVKDFTHEIDDVKAHKAVTGDKKGKLVRTNETTGEIELVEGAREEVISGLSWYIPNVLPKYQAEVYRIDATGNMELFNVYTKYFPAEKTLYVESGTRINEGRVVIKQI